MSNGQEETFTGQLKKLWMEMICFLLAIDKWPSDVSFREDFVRYFLLLAYIAILLYGLQFLNSYLKKWTDASISVNEGDLIETFVGDTGESKDPGEWKPPEWKSQSVMYDPDFPQDMDLPNNEENEKDLDMGLGGGLMGGDSVDASLDSEPSKASSMFPLWFLVRPVVDFFQIKGESLLSQKTYLQLLIILIVIYGTTFLFVYVLSQAGQYGNVSLWIWMGIVIVLYSVYVLMRMIMNMLNTVGQSSMSNKVKHTIPHRKNLSILITCTVILHGIGRHISRIAHAQLSNMEEHILKLYKFRYNINEDIATLERYIKEEIANVSPILQRYIEEVKNEIRILNTFREQYTSTLLGTEESFTSLDQWSWIDWYRIAEVYLFKFGRIRVKRDLNGQIQPDDDPNPLTSWIPWFIVSDTLKPGQTATRFLVMKQRHKLIWAAILLALLMNLLFSKMSYPEFVITMIMLFSTGGILTMLNKYRFSASGQA